MMVASRLEFRYPLWYMITTIPITEKDVLESTLEVLKKGGVIVYPTETCYGLGCDATNEEAVERIFKIKEREKNKPVLVIAENKEKFFEYVEWNETIEELTRAYWPGALTIVASLKERASHTLAKGVIGSGGTIAFRVTSHPFAARLAQKLGRPLVSTSANLSSYPNPYDIKYVTSMFEGGEVVPDLIINAGDLPHQSPSTIVQVDAEGNKKVLRQGEIVIS